MLIRIQQQTRRLLRHSRKSDAAQAEAIAAQAAFDELQQKRARTSNSPVRTTGAATANEPPAPETSDPRIVLLSEQVAVQIAQAMVHQHTGRQVDTQAQG
jgi:uncharacterized protein (DUF2345 family)